MGIVEHLERLGGVASRRALLAHVPRAELERAVCAGDVVRDGRGRYALPAVEEDLRVAARLGGVLSLTSAALRHGWAVKAVPARPHVTVSRGRKLPASHQVAHVHRAELHRDQVDGPTTSVETTLLGCLRTLPFDEALCVADSARREGVEQGVLDRIGELARGPGSAQVRRVARLCSPAAANPFESVTRAIACDIPGLSVQPQVVIVDGAFRARPDLVDERLRIVIEADSFEWHGKRSALASDARRYNRLVVAGWMVLRFSYEDVMFHPAEVREVMIAAVALAELMNDAVGRLPPAA